MSEWYERAYSEGYGIGYDVARDECTKELKQAQERNDKLEYGLQSANEAQQEGATEIRESRKRIAELEKFQNDVAPFLAIHNAFGYSMGE